MTPYVYAWLLSFAFTEVVEVPVYRTLLRTSVFRAFVPSALTHPVIWFVIFPNLHASYVAKGCLSEAFAVGVEACLCFLMLRQSRFAIAKRSAVWLRALAISTLANGLSVGLGLLSRSLFGVP